MSVVHCHDIQTLPGEVETRFSHLDICVIPFLVIGVKHIQIKGVIGTELTDVNLYKVNSGISNFSDHVRSNYDRS